MLAELTEALFACNDAGKNFMNLKNPQPYFKLCITNSRRIAFTFKEDTTITFIHMYTKQ